MSPDEFRAELRRVCGNAGSQKAWADANGVSEVYLSDVLNGRREPGPMVLRALGLKRVVTYERENSKCMNPPSNT